MLSSIPTAAASARQTTRLWRRCAFRLRRRGSLTKAFHALCCATATSLRRRTSSVIERERKVASLRERSLADWALIARVVGAASSSSSIGGGSSSSSSSSTASAVGHLWATASRALVSVIGTHCSVVELGLALLPPAGPVPEAPSNATNSPLPLSADNVEELVVTVAPTTQHATATGAMAAAHTPGTPASACADTGTAGLPAYDGTTRPLKRLGNAVATAVIDMMAGRRASARFERTRGNAVELLLLLPLRTGHHSVRHITLFSSH
jgi:hypothetical protein